MTTTHELAEMTLSPKPNEYVACAREGVYDATFKVVPAGTPYQFWQRYDTHSNSAVGPGCYLFDLNGQGFWVADSGSIADNVPYLLSQWI